MGTINPEKSSGSCFGKKKERATPRRREAVKKKGVRHQFIRPKVTLGGNKKDASRQGLRENKKGEEKRERGIP